MKNILAHLSLSRRGISVAGGVITAFTGALLLFLPEDLTIKALSFDIPFALRKPNAPPEAVIVYMDEESYQELGQNPDHRWDRALHAQLVQELTRQKAKVIAIDALMDTPWPAPEVDRQLAEAIKAHGKIVLAASESVKETSTLSTRRLLQPLEALATNAQFGLVEFPIWPDQTIRELPLPGQPPPFFWVAAALAGKTPVSPAARRWLNPYGPGLTLDHVSYSEVLRTNAIPAGRFMDKTVFVGSRPVIDAKGENRSDSHQTPYTRWSGRLSPGVEIQATAFLNLLREEWLEQISPWAELILILLFGALFGAGLSLLRPWMALSAALAGSAAVFALDVWLVSQYQLWFYWLIPAGVQIPAACFCALVANLARIQREKEALELRIAGAMAATPNPPLDSSISDAPTVASPVTGSGLVPGSRPAIPDHTLLRVIGRGGYGEVWLAKDIIGMYHAVKVIFRAGFGSSSPYEREFRGIQKFTPISRSHPGLVHILHVGRNDPQGYFYYIMEIGDDEQTGQEINPDSYAPKNLARELHKRKKLPVIECIDLAISLTATLDYLHKQKLIHRDIKPSNLIFVNGTPKLADIGLVTDLSEHTRTESTYLGTEGYIAPEGPGTAAADVYSLGKVFYEAAMGLDRNRFPELPASLLDRQDHELLMRLNEIILRACHHNSAERYQTAAQMHADLLELQKQVTLQRA